MRNNIEHVLLSTTDARVWGRKFVRLHGGDEDLMISWFASAIETGRSHCNRPHSEHPVMEAEDFYATTAADDDYPS